MSSRHATDAALLTVLLGVLAGGCSRDLEQAYESLFAQPVTLQSADRREFQLTHEQQPYRYPDLENADGTITRVIWVEIGQAANIEELIKAHPAYGSVKLSNRPGFFRDGLEKDPKAGNQNEALVITGKREAVDAVTDLVTFILTSLPLIEIEARIVEVRETDEFGFGTDLFLLEREDHAFDPEDPGAPLSPSKTFFDRVISRRGIPGATGLPSLLVDLGTIQGNIQLDLLVQALKIFTKADVLSAPRIAVLNGFRAEFSAGDDVPILKQNVTGTTVSITTEFRKTGIKLLVVPQLVSRDTIRMSVKTSVENLVGTTNLVAGGTVFPTPIISVREATTSVDVRDGAAVVIGGLFTTSKVERQDRVPVLGEIPILNVLFSSTHSDDQRTNLLFFIRPRLISPAGETGASVIVPPPEQPDGK